MITIPGFGPVVAPAYTSIIDVPALFRDPKAVGSALGLTPRLRQLGETDRVGRISRCGDAMMSLSYRAVRSRWRRMFVCATPTKRRSYARGVSG
ncbi:IS110 family transposase (plasmid) [Agrobacterium tumefaciens]|uniref:IS110 family transposase n=1 Tax=Agrobacterium tumefaciens TaxID=358 RepID=A0AAJ4N9C8_AGRTU|nr:IS110 family transposase [Agrobacterium tumefaciens]